MAGISATLANELLDHAFRNSVWTPPVTVYAKLHTGDPGADGTAAPSAQTTRVACTWAAATGGAIALSNTPEFTLNATETITHVSFWTAATGGVFLASAAASVAKGGVSGDIIRIQTAPISFTGLAA
ncbi:hypothetical protein SEA_PURGAMENSTRIS_23 [Mycobacterium phage Purgamenstris]|uniref:Uncharacterized protein n=6 Tax=Charlievirus redi TaxID=2003505 RepID=A0A1I9SC77_9CAUD|nr:head protein [Mycobacterium phage Redi]AOZ64454.1 hypothetical protein SEA_PHANCYPHIN_23 [Mycobacterium phage PhancyPhin]QAY16005.1 hypothetical protein SEA_BABERUTH_23 [Mycobacterium phage BabeRuth]QBI99152.1 hypothetical protein SEA_NENAE_23 [Mycobacterium phage Nenae]QBI99223.1 hypothetical protein SEA_PURGAMENSTRIS_23 [Mycobacterium phage Purgamenstris]QBI99901.1 hypothetical protein SEA_SHRIMPFRIEDEGG_23 [Mycobacterium phage ShrimpFriedEgg]